MGLLEKTTYLRSTWLFHPYCHMPRDKLLHIR